MTYPTINTYYVNESIISIYWKIDPKVPVRWNLYGASSISLDFTPPSKGVVLPGAFTLIQEKIANVPSYQTPGSILIQFTRTELGIGPEDTYYFLIAPVDANNVVSPLDVNNLHSVPLADTYFVDEAGQPANVVYRSFEFIIPTTGGWDADRKLDIVNLLGRPAKQIKIDSASLGVSGYNGYFFVKLNGVNSDYISVRHEAENPWPFELLRGGMVTYSIYFHNPGSETANVRLFIAG